jgi:alkanesulfonate monooxygenase SsuD/methylene tetrahydromethanopterin reductase-like flavin-dependent oxidoreductase (luciferase family)
VRLGFYVTGSATSSYDDLIAQVEELDAAGFHAVWLRERHFHRDHGGRNFFSAPLVVAAHLAQRTSGVRIGLGARILSIDHPLRIAEDAATVDILSGGRLDVGVARVGEQDLYQLGFGTTPGDARSRFEEALEIILRAWTGEPFAFSGRHWSFPEVTVGPAPVQKPHPPVYLVGISDSTLRFGAERGFPLLLAAAQPVPLVRRTQETYFGLLTENGHDPSAVSLPLNRFVYVGETDERAETEMRDAVMGFIGRSDSNIRDFLGLRPEEITYERLVEDVFIVGSPERCVERILELDEVLDVRDLVFTFNYFTLDHGSCLASMRRFLEDVRPHLPSPREAATVASAPGTRAS